LWSAQRYARLYNWTTLLLVVAAYIASVGGSETRNLNSSANDFSVAGRTELLGISVFSLTLVRVVGGRFFPAQESRMPAWMELGARLGHWYDLFAANAGAGHGHSRCMVSKVTR